MAVLVYKMTHTEYILGESRLIGLPNSISYYARVFLCNVCIKHFSLLYSVIFIDIIELSSLLRVARDFGTLCKRKYLTQDAIELHRRLRHQPISLLFYFSKYVLCSVNILFHFAHKN